MTLRWPGAGLMEVEVGFRRLKAHQQLPALRRALTEYQAQQAAKPRVAPHREDA
jgi:hypothetical protein